MLRKRGVVALLRNICFDSAQHKQLLEDFVILPTILMPLAGPEELSDEDNDKLPIELQVNSHADDYQHFDSLFNAWQL